MPSVNKNNFTLFCPSLARPVKLLCQMISRALLSTLALAICLPFNHFSFAQAVSGSDDTVRVTVSVNSDGSRTVYQFDNAKHEATATTTESDGKPRGKIVYQIDAAGRFASGVSFGPAGKFLFK